ncbi:MAG: hypothetical protein MUE49_14950, partial [Rhodospirillales bacterium]|nr:hypothetical protein [Rhodospirillales bacterium]
MLSGLHQGEGAPARRAVGQRRDGSAIVGGQRPLEGHRQPHDAPRQQPVERPRKGGGGGQPFGDRLRFLADEMAAGRPEGAGAGQPRRAFRSAGDHFEVLRCLRVVAVTPGGKPRPPGGIGVAAAAGAILAPARAPDAIHGRLANLVHQRQGVVRRQQPLRARRAEQLLRRAERAGFEQ